MERYNSIDEAKEALRKEMGKDDWRIVEVDGHRTLIVGTDIVFDGFWSDAHDRLREFGAEDDLCVEEASRLRDDFIVSLMKLLGVNVCAHLYTEF